MNKKTLLVNVRSIVYWLKSISFGRIDPNDCYLYVRERLNNLYILNRRMWHPTLYTLFTNSENNLFFKGKCYLGSMLCILGLDDDALLVRGELLSNIKGIKWIHGWVEFIYNSKEMVLDTTMCRIFYKDVYHSLYEPRADIKIPRKIIMESNYFQSALDEFRSSNNELDIEEFDKNRKIFERNLNKNLKKK